METTSTLTDTLGKSNSTLYGKIIIVASTTSNKMEHLSETSIHLNIGAYKKSRIYSIGKKNISCREIVSGSIFNYEARLNPITFPLIKCLHKLLLEKCIGGTGAKALKELLILKLQSLECESARPKAFSQKFCKANIELLHGLIENDTDGQLKLKDIASAYQTNESHFSRTFKKVMGESLTSYINQYRVQKAKNIILKSGASVLQIALSVGFNNAGHFSRVFKDKMGLSPLQFRHHQVQVISS